MAWLRIRDWNFGLELGRLHLVLLGGLLGGVVLLLLDDPGIPVPWRVESRPDGLVDDVLLKLQRERRVQGTLSRHNRRILYSHTSLLVVVE